MAHKDNDPRNSAVNAQDATTPPGQSAPAPDRSSDAARKDQGAPEGRPDIQMSSPPPEGGPSPTQARRPPTSAGPSQRDIQILRNRLEKEMDAVERLEDQVLELRKRQASLLHGNQDLQDEVLAVENQQVREEEYWNGKIAEAEETLKELREEGGTMREIMGEEDESIESITGKIEGLNERTEELAAAISKRLDSLQRRSSEAASEEQLRVARSNLCKALDARTLDLISPRAKSNDRPAWFKLCARAIVLHYLSDVIEEGYIGLVDEQNKVLSDVYKIIDKNESHALSVRWRRLTHRHIRQLKNDWEKEAVAEVSSKLLDTLSDLCFASGCGRGAKEQLRREFQRDLDNLAQYAVLLSVTMRERTLSDGVTLIVPLVGSKFNPVSMENKFTKQPGGTVWLTYELGIGVHKGPNLRRLREKAQVFSHQ